MEHIFEGLRHLPEVWLCDFIILNYLQRLNKTEAETMAVRFKNDWPWITKLLHKTYFLQNNYSCDPCESQLGSGD